MILKKQITIRTGKRTGTKLKLVREYFSIDSCYGCVFKEGFHCGLPYPNKCINYYYSSYKYKKY